MEIEQQEVLHEVWCSLPGSVNDEEDGTVGRWNSAHSARSDGAMQKLQRSVGPLFATDGCSPPRLDEAVELKAKLNAAEACIQGMLEAFGVVGCEREDPDFIVRALALARAHAAASKAAQAVEAPPPQDLSRVLDVICAFAGKPATCGTCSRDIKSLPELIDACIAVDESLGAPSIVATERRQEIVEHCDGATSPVVFPPVPPPPTDAVPQLVEGTESASRPQTTVGRIRERRGSLADVRRTGSNSSLETSNLPPALAPIPEKKVYRNGGFWSRMWSRFSCGAPPA